MKTISATFLLFALTLLLAACSPAPTLPPPSPVPSQTPLPPTATPAPEIAPDGIPDIPLSDRLIATININFPDQMMFAAGYLWVKTSDGHVVQVDPETTTIVNDIKVDTTADPNSYCFGLGTDDTDVWACTTGGDHDNPVIDVVRIDPQSGEVTATIPVGKIFDQGWMPLADNRIWVITGDGDQLVGIDVETNEPGPPMDLGMRCFSLSALGDSLYASCALENLVIRIDPQTGAITGQAELRSPRWVATTQDSLWVVQDTKLTRLDPDTLSTLVVFTGLPALALRGGAYMGEDAVWARTEEGFLYKIDPATNNYVEHIVADPPVLGGSVLVTDDAIWVTTFHDGTLMKIARD